MTYKPRSSVDVTDLRSVDVLRSGFAASKRRSFPRISFADSEKMKSTDDVPGVFLRDTHGFANLELGIETGLINPW